MATARTYGKTPLAQQVSKFTSNINEDLVAQMIAADRGTSVTDSTALARMLASPPPMPLPMPLPMPPPTAPGGMLPPWMAPPMGPSMAPPMAPPMGGPNELISLMQGQPMLIPAEGTVFPWDVPENLSPGEEFVPEGWVPPPGVTPEESFERAGITYPEPPFEVLPRGKQGYEIKGIPMGTQQTPGGLGAQEMLLQQAADPSFLVPTPPGFKRTLQGVGPEIPLEEGRMAPDRLPVHPNVYRETGRPSVDMAEGPSAGLPAHLTSGSIEQIFSGWQDLADIEEKTGVLIDFISNITNPVERELQIKAIEDYLDEVELNPEVRASLNESLNQAQVAGLTGTDTGIPTEGIPATAEEGTMSWAGELSRTDEGREMIWDNYKATNPNFRLMSPMAETVYNRQERQVRDQYVIESLDPNSPWGKQKGVEGALEDIDYKNYLAAVFDPNNSTAVLWDKTTWGNQLGRIYNTLFRGTGTGDVSSFAEALDNLAEGVAFTGTPSDQASSYGVLGSGDLAMGAGSTDQPVFTSSQTQPKTQASWADTIRAYARDPYTVKRWIEHRELKGRNPIQQRFGSQFISNDIDKWLFDNTTVSIEGMTEDDEFKAAQSLLEEYANRNYNWIQQP